jgi:hypothetical protein
MKNKKNQSRVCFLGRPAAASQKGAALIIALLCLLIISALAAGIMVSTQSEMWTSSNYRQVNQARYVAEAGAQQVVNWIADRGTNNTLLPWGSSLVATGYNLNNYPVVDNSGNYVVLAPTASSGYQINKISPSYPSTTLSDFTNSLVNQTVSGGGVTGSFSAVAQLLSARLTCGGASAQWLTDWKVISQATVNQAKVQVVEVVSKVQVGSSSCSASSNSFSFDYGVLSTGTGCGSVSMAGGQYTNGYNSQGSGNIGNNNPSMLGTNGSVATFGSVKITNGAYVNGNVYTPNSGKGKAGTYGISGGPSGLNGSAACASPGTMWSVNEDNSGSEVGCTITTSGKKTTQTCPGGSSQVTYPLDAKWTDPSVIPDPVMPTVAANTTACVGYNGLCNGGSGGGAGCAITIPPSTLMDGTTPGGGPANFGKVNFGSCAVITLQPGIYNVDTLYISNGGKIIVPTTGPVVINVLNNSGSTTPLSLDGGTMSNGGGNPLNFSIVYAGSNTVNVNAGANTFTTIYAPHAPVNVTGNAGLYGAIVGNSFTFTGSGHVVYDTNLSGKPVNFPVGKPAPPTTTPYHVDQFSWNAF